jgi:hypothetical protein
MNKNTVIVTGKRSQQYSTNGICNKARSKTGLLLLGGTQYSYNSNMAYSWAWSNLIFPLRMTGYNSREGSLNGS